jgi:acyl transferase domain-containing protein
MGAELYARFSLFARAVNEICDLLDPHLDHPLRPVLFAGTPEPGLLDKPAYAQTGSFALQVGLARLLAEFGVRPEAVTGHSIGEIAAAHVAGMFDLPDACRLVAARAVTADGTGVTFRRTRIPIIDAGTGEIADETIATPEHWARRIAEPLEPQATVLDEGTWPMLSVFDGRHSEVTALTRALARLHAAGTTVRWPVFFSDLPARRKIPLPTYAFQRQRYWLDATPPRG